MLLSNIVKKIGRYVSLLVILFGISQIFVSPVYANPKACKEKCKKNKRACLIKQEAAYRKAVKACEKSEKQCTFGCQGNSECEKVCNTTYSQCMSLLDLSELQDACETKFELCANNCKK